MSQRDWDDAHLINVALDIHEDDPAFGYRFIADELTAAGHQVGENRVARLCSLQRIYSIFAKKRGLHRRPGPPQLAHRLGDVPPVVAARRHFGRFQSAGANMAAPVMTAAPSWSSSRRRTQAAARSFIWTSCPGSPCVSSSGEGGLALVAERRDSLREVGGREQG